MANIPLLNKANNSGSSRVPLLSREVVSAAQNNNSINPASINWDALWKKQQQNKKPVKKFTSSFDRTLNQEKGAEIKIEHAPKVERESMVQTMEKIQPKWVKDKAQQFVENWYNNRKSILDLGKGPLTLRDVIPIPDNKNEYTLAERKYDPLRKNKEEQKRMQPIAAKGIQSRLQSVEDPNWFWELANTTKGSLGRVMVSMGRTWEKANESLGFREASEGAAKFTDQWRLYLAEHPEYAMPEDLQKKPLSEKWYNPRYIANLMADQIPIVSSAVAATFLGNAICGPTCAATAGFMFTSSLEGGIAYEEAIQQGLPVEQADKIRYYTGAINGALEELPIMNLLKLAGGADKVVKRTVLAKVINFLIGSAQQAATEATTESLQEITQIAVNEFVQKRPDVLETVVSNLDRIAEAGYGGLVVGFFSGGGATQTQDLVNLDYSNLNIEKIKNSLQLIAADQRGEIALPFSKAETEIIDNLKIDSKFAEQRLTDVAGKIDKELGKTPIAGKAQTELGKKILSLDVKNLDSPGKFFTEVSQVIKSDKNYTPQMLVELKATTQDMMNYLQPGWDINIYNKKIEKGGEIPTGMYVFHGTSEGAARSIQREGKMKIGQAIGSKKTGYGKELFFSDNQEYAKSYGIRKSSDNYLLRVKKTDDMIHDPNTKYQGDYKTNKNISSDKIEIKTPNGKWVPLNNYDFDLQINRVDKFKQIDYSKLGKVIVEAHDQTLKEGGITIDLEGNKPVEGYAYSPYKELETVKNESEFSEQDISDFVEKNYDVLKEEGNHLGLWKDDNGNIYIDIYRVGPPDINTLVEARKANQIAVFDLKTFQEINLEQYEKTNSINLNEGQVKGRIEEGTLGGIPKEKSGRQKGQVKSPSVKRIMGEKSDVVQTSESLILKNKLRAEAKAAKEAVAQYKREQKFLNFVYNRILREMSKPRAKQKRAAYFVKQLGEFNQTVINDVKNELNLKKPINKMTLPELETFVSKMRERLQFKIERGYKPSKETAEKFSIKPEPKKQLSEEDYLLNRVIDKKTPLKKKSGRKFKRLKTGTEKLLAPISTRLENISPTLKYALRKFEYNLSKFINSDRQGVLSYLEKTKLSANDFADLDLAMKNGDIKKIDEINRKYKTSNEYDEVRKILDKLYDRANAVGYDIGYEKNYWPRMIKDVDGFLEYFEKQEFKSIIDDAVKRKEMDLGRVLTSEEKAHLINTMIRGYRGGQIMLSKTGAMKNRIVDVVTPELNKYYYDFKTSLLSYITETNNAIEARKFFGKGNKDLGYNNIVDSIGAYTTELLVKEEISPSQEMELRNILTARFDPRGTHGFIGLYKNLAYIDVMGSFLNAVTQLGDQAWALYRSGVWRTLKADVKAIFQKSDITKEDMGIEAERIAQEFSDGNKVGKVVDKVFTLTGLTKIDRLGKEALVNGTLEKYQKMAKKPSLEFYKKIEDIFGREADQVLDDLSNGVISDNVKLLMFNELLDFHPVALSEMPEMYLKSGNGRIFYMLKSYTLKQFDIFRREAFREMANGNVMKGTKNLLYLTTLLILCNATADEIKDFLLGRKTSWTDRLVDQLAMLVGFSRYTTNNVVSEGLGSALIDQIIPPTNFIDNVSKDLINLYKNYDESISINDLRSVQDIPLIGKFYYWWFGKGAEYKEKYDKEESLFLKNLNIEGLDNTKLDLPKIEGLKIKGLKLNE